MYPVYDCAFVIRLKCHDVDFVLRSRLFREIMHIVERLAAVD